MKRYSLGAALGTLILIFAAPEVPAQKSRSSVSAAEVTGTFRMNFTGKFRRSYNEISIASVRRGKLRISMQLMYPMIVKGERSANTGVLDGEATIAGDTATYRSKEFGPCTITIKFVRPGLIKVEQGATEADCGFGFGVVAGGTYRKVNSRKPSFN